MTQPLVDALLDARALIARTRADDAGVLRQIDRLIAESLATGGDPPGAGPLFAPSGPLGTLAEAGGWQDRFAAVAGRYNAAAERLRFLFGLLERVRHTADLSSALRPPPGTGVTAPVCAHGRVVLALDPPADVRPLAAAWRIDRPFAVCTHAEEQRWILYAGAEDLPGRRLAVNRVGAGPWFVEARLERSPEGPVPGIAVGNHPAYDLLEYGGAISAIVASPLSWGIHAPLPPA